VTGLEIDLSGTGINSRGFVAGFQAGGNWQMGGNRNSTGTSNMEVRKSRLPFRHSKPRQGELKLLWPPGQVGGVEIDCKLELRRVLHR
jgi:hypothetical protein